MYQSKLLRNTLKLFYAIKSYLSCLYTLYYDEASNEFCGTNLRAIAPAGNTTPFERMSQRWRTVSNIVSDLTSSRFDSQTYCSRDERVTPRPTWLNDLLHCRPVAVNTKFPKIKMRHLVRTILNFRGFPTRKNQRRWNEKFRNHNYQHCCFNTLTLQLLYIRTKW